ENVQPKICSAVARTKLSKTSACRGQLASGVVRMKWTARTEAKERRRRKRADCVSSKPASFSITPFARPISLSSTNADTLTSEPNGTPNMWILSSSVKGTPGRGEALEHKGSNHVHSHFAGLRCKPTAGP